MRLALAVPALLALALAGCVQDTQPKWNTTPLPLPENFDPKAVDPKMKQRVYDELTQSSDAAQTCSNRATTGIISKGEKDLKLALGKGYDACPDEWQRVVVARQARQRIDGTQAFEANYMLAVLRSTYIEQFTPYFTGQHVKSAPGQTWQVVQPGTE
ncbi:MAG: hypothetical protein ACRCXM_04810 [Beijerinckiaceae bacterium]